MEVKSIIKHFNNDDDDDDKNTIMSKLQSD